MATVRWKTSLSIVFHICLVLIRSCLGRNHAVNLEEEERRTFELSKFGFLQGGFLKVNFSDMTFTVDDKGGNIQGHDLLIDNFGFSLEKTTSDGISPYMEQHAEKCILRDQSFKKQISVALVKFNLDKKKIIVEKYGDDFINLAVIESKVIPSTMTATTTANTEPRTTTNVTTKITTSTKTTKTEPNTGTATNKTTKLTTSTKTTKAEPTTGTSTNITKMATLKSLPMRGNQSTAVSENNSMTATLGKSAVLGENHTTTHNVSGNLAAISSSNQRRRRGAVTATSTPATVTPIELPLIVTMSNNSTPVYSGNFVVKVKTKAEEGLYNLYFHNCANYKKDRKAKVQVNIKVQIMEKNLENYLSAGEEPLPYMFGVLSVMFFATAVYWFHVLRQNRDYTYKVHYMMFVLILLKALDLAFQAINNHIISTDGKPAESWAVLYYITHLLKGALLFTTIVLIGTGYFFIKHVLSDRDKKIFMIVIPLQILANTAQIVMESTEEAKLHYTTWKEVFILVDLLCCGAILFPVVWISSFPLAVLLGLIIPLYHTIPFTGPDVQGIYFLVTWLLLNRKSIRHLQEASETDGKAALNLAKLKLFRHFYVMIVCYIYFTRIIVYLIKITVPFQYMWLDDFFNNVASYVFFVLTGYKFRPAPDNPYLHVPQEESDEEVQMEEVVTTAGLAKGVTRLQASSEGRKIFETA